MTFSFDHLGCGLHSRRVVAGDLEVDLADCVCRVTDADSGLGYALIRGLALRGATVWTLCRDTLRGKKVRQPLVCETSRQTLHVDGVRIPHTVL